MIAVKASESFTGTFLILIYDFRSFNPRNRISQIFVHCCDWSELFLLLLFRRILIYKWLNYYFRFEWYCRAHKKFDWKLSRLARKEKRLRNSVCDINKCSNIQIKASLLKQLKDLMYIFTLSWKSKKQKGRWIMKTNKSFRYSIDDVIGLL